MAPHLLNPCGMFRFLVIAALCLIACGEQDLLAAQRLRYTVFVEELGANGPLVDHDQRLERDEFDTYFDHLILVDKTADQTSLDYVLK